MNNETNADQQAVKQPYYTPNCVPATSIYVPGRNHTAFAPQAAAQPSAVLPSSASGGPPPGTSYSHRRTSAAVRSLPVSSQQQQYPHPNQPELFQQQPWGSAAAAVPSAGVLNHHPHNPLLPRPGRHLPLPLSPGLLPVHHAYSSSSNSGKSCTCWPLHLISECCSSTASKHQQHSLRLLFAPSPAAAAATGKPFGHLGVMGSAAAAVTGDGSVLTFRAVAAGLAVGAVLCFSNMYFGLQTGWVTMGSLQSAILGYGLFQALGAAKLIRHPLTVAENVIVQTTAVATATMPLAAGLVGIIPALELLTPEDNPPHGPIKLTPWQLLGWCSALAFFGVFVAVPLRYQTIIREKLRFPSGTATASVIRTLHGLEETAESDDEGPDNNNSRSRSSVRRRQQQQQQQQAVAAPSSCQVDLEVAVSAELEAESASLLPDSAPHSSHQYSHPSYPSHSVRQLKASEQQQQQWARALRLLLWCFGVSGTYSLAASWLKPLRVLPVFDWVGLPAATAWGWVLQPSAGYIGQGMIMGPKTAWSMMAGAVTGWAILGPAAKARGWAPGPIKNIETGAAGWLMWLGLALLLGDCFSELALLLLQTAWEKAAQRGWVKPLNPGEHLNRNGGGSKGLSVGFVSSRSNSRYAQLIDESEQGLEAGFSRSGVAGSGVRAQLELGPTGSSGGLQTFLPQEPQTGTQFGGPGAAGGSGSGYDQQQAVAGSSSSLRHDDHPNSEGVSSEGKRSDSSSWMLSTKFWLPGLLLSTGLSTAILGPLMGMPLHEPLIAVLVALLVALLAVRALGQTDLNPVSGVGKISQLVFALVSPGAVVPNLVAGAIAEAGAQQAGDLMQDFKTAHLLGVPPSSQLLAMLVGSAASVPLSVGAYMLYTSAWEVPGPVLPAPTAQIWLDMAKLVNGGQLPDHVAPFCAAAAAIAAALPVLQHVLQRLKKQRQQQQQQGDVLYAPSYLAAPRKDSEDGSTAYEAPAGPATAADAYTTSSRQQQQLIKPPGTCWCSPEGASLIVRSVRTSLNQARLRLLHTWRARTAADWVLALLPSGVGFAVGMYLTPNWTVPRVIGSVVEQTWLLLHPRSHAAFMMVTASGLVLGEGCASVVTAVVHAAFA